MPFATSCPSSGCLSILALTFFFSLIAYVYQYGKITFDGKYNFICIIFDYKSLIFLSNVIIL